MNEVKISIIIPVYNKEKFLKQCLESVVNQTMEDIEIIVVDDGSTDSSLKIIEEFQKEYNNIILIKQENQGVINARINGYKVAKGKYIGWVDADDFIQENMYQRLYEEIIKKDSDIAICNYNFYPKEIKHKKKWFKEFKGEVDYTFIQQNTVFWNKIIRKKLLDKLNIESLLHEIGESAYTIVLINTNKIVTINENLYNYRVGHESFSTNYKNIKWFEENVDRAKKKREIIKGSKLEEKWKDFFDYTIFYYTLLMMIVAINTNNRKIYKKYQKEIKNKNTEKNKKLLKERLGFIESFILMKIVYKYYYLSKPIVKIVLKMK